MKKGIVSEAGLTDARKTFRGEKMEHIASNTDVDKRSFSVVQVLGFFMLISTSVPNCVSQSPSEAHSPVPTSWTDADNGYKVTRLTEEPDSRAIASRRNAFTPDGRDMFYVSPFGLHVLNLATKKSRLLVSGRIASLAVGTKTRRVFFSLAGDTSLYVVDADTGVIRKISDLPSRGEIYSASADETVLAGKAPEPGSPVYKDYLAKAKDDLAKEQATDPSIQLSEDKVKERAMKMRAASGTPEQLFTVDTATGKVNSILQITDWISYAQFSPSDPTLILYAHEGMYYEADRIWTIRSDGSQNQLIHQRTQRDESATREFWSRDGKTIWYEWQKPRGKGYAMVGYDIATGSRKIYKMEKGEASISYDVAGNGLFCGSGHRAVSAKEGSNRGGKQSIELLRPVSIDTKMKNDPNFQSLVGFEDEISNTYTGVKYSGWFRRVTLANMFKNDYTKIEPNIRFSPDGKRVIFTSNMLGPTYVFAVDLTSN